MLERRLRGQAKINNRVHVYRRLDNMLMRAQRERGLTGRLQLIEVIRDWCWSREADIDA